MQQSENSAPAISVVICTFNRADLVANALQTLCEQTIDKPDYEVIVVDNNSKDNTQAVTEDFCRSYPNIRYCFETKQGLSYARNRGWREAKGAYVAYMDDECKVPAQWLTVAKQIIERLAPAVFGGPYFGYLNSPPPRWWKMSYESFELSENARSLETGEYVRGGNIFIQRRVLERLGGFSTDLGMSGEKIGYGEESQLQRHIRATMPDDFIYYDPELYVYHLVRPEKMTLRWILYSHFVASRHSYHVFRDKNAHEIRPPLFRLMAQAVITTFRFFWDFIVAVLRRDRKRYPYLQNYLYENTVEHLHTLGSIYERYIHKC
jgi:glycosyltransferase involved in cell wall biosynthesis